MGMLIGAVAIVVGPILGLILSSFLRSSYRKKKQRFNKPESILVKVFITLGSVVGATIVSFLVIADYALESFAG
ncbi:hypothetical protein ACFOND_05985 [Reinekea marina]|uniref:Uncharacterized protein n=2 Tax=Reinekea marina TaxID=1310421 RepID=A0ABV7WQQ8_9GAMM